LSHSGLITIEGIDGAGKSTLAAGLLRELTARGHPVELLREPGGVEVSERIRALVTDPSLDVAPRAEALLYAAARAQLVQELIEPRLADGALLLLDRFLDSSLAYQGAGRALGVEQVRAINGFAIGSLEPRLTLLLRLPAALARARKQGGGAPDRLEAEDDEFFAVVAEAYEALARAEPARFAVIDATADPDRVLADALLRVEEALG
jgi:dTMP kinase